MYKEGDWLSNKAGDVKGFVSTSNQHSTTLWVLKPWGLVRHYNLSNYNLYKMGDFLTPDELYELIDMALAMKDDEWFIKLWDRMEKARERH